MDNFWENIAAFLVPFSLAALMFGVMIRAMCPYCKEKRKFKRSARATAVVNTMQTAQKICGAIGSRYRRYYCKLEYSFEDKSGNFHDASYMYSQKSFSPKRFEYGDELEVYYDESAPENTVPQFLVKRERIVAAVVGLIIAAVMAVIAAMFISSYFV